MKMSAPLFDNPPLWNLEFRQRQKRFDRKINITAAGIGKSVTVNCLTPLCVGVSSPPLQWAEKL